MQSKGLHKTGVDRPGGAHQRRRLTGERRTEHRWDFFQDPDGQWRWQKLDRDGNLVALSPESFHYAIECVHSAEVGGFVIDDPIDFARMLNAQARIAK